MPTLPEDEQLEPEGMVRKMFPFPGGVFSQVPCSSSGVPFFVVGDKFLFRISEVGCFSAEFHTLYIKAIEIHGTENENV